MKNKNAPTAKFDAPLHDHIKEVWELYDQTNEGKAKYELEFCRCLKKQRTKLGQELFNQLCETYQEDAHGRPKKDGFPVSYDVARGCIRVAECKWITEHEERWPDLPAFRWTLIAIADLKSDEERDKYLADGTINPDATVLEIKNKKKSGSGDGAGDGEGDGGAGEENDDGEDEETDEDFDEGALVTFTVRIRLLHDEIAAFEKQLKILGEDDFKRDIEISHIEDLRPSQISKGKIDPALRDNMFQGAGVDRDRLLATITGFGPSLLEPRLQARWSPENPLRGYGHLISEVVYNYLAPRDDKDESQNTQAYCIDVPGYGEHYFLKWPNAGPTIDLAAEQFNDYSLVKHVEAMRATLPEMPSEACRRLAGEYFLSVVGDWEDPYPPPVIEDHEGISVIRDDQLKYGAKARFLDSYIRCNPDVEEFVYPTTRYGYGQISLAHVAAKYGKKPTVFVAKSNELHRYSQIAQDLGAKIIKVAGGQGRDRTRVKRAKEYVAQDPKKRRLVPFGFADPTVFGSIVSVARQLTFEPDEVWTVAGSGTLNRGLQMAWPKAKCYAVSVGHDLKSWERGSAEIILHPLEFEQRCKKEERPPFNSVLSYDAKCWAQMLERTKDYRGKNKILFWNVAGEIKP